VTCGVPDIITHRLQTDAGNCLVTLPTRAVAKYCYERVSVGYVCVCLSAREHICRTERAIPKSQGEGAILGFSSPLTKPCTA